MRVRGRRITSTTISSGRFHCPNEEANRPYQLREAREWFTLLSAPVKDLGVISEYVQCDSCGLTYQPASIQSVVSAAENP